MSMTKKDFQVVADLTATLAIAGVPIIDVLLNEQLSTADILNKAQVRAHAYIACKALNGTNAKFSWPMFTKAVVDSATAQVVARRENANQ